MKFSIDHDYHIHSHISLCSDDPEQSNERILRYAEENGLRKICLTDHFWDETLPARCGFYNQQGFERIKKALPLPQQTQKATTQNLLALPKFLQLFSL